MEASKILQSDLLDIVFENRNKQYGAYELRKNYSRRTISAVTITLCTVASIIAITSFSQKNNNTFELTDKEEVHVMSIMEEEPKVIPPVVPPPVHTNPPPAKTIDYVIPVIVPDINAALPWQPRTK
ncbi:MAG: hypothetical protein EOO05_19670 [Chitinophagaceae bacterium]|nr:MAG: hypothetical protein EOO05_19670 [Chitinophagaceae bacterium]